MASTNQSFEVRPSGGPLGAEIRGLDLSAPIAADVRARLVAAWHEHIVLVFRDQALSDPELVEFSEIFGKVLADDRPVDYHRHLDTTMPDIIDVVSNLVVDGKPIGALGAGEAVWHTDTFPYPNGGLILHALEVPSEGGNTRFSNLYRAYATLPEEIRIKVEGKISIHDRAPLAMVGSYDKTKSPDPRFPIIRTHGGTGRKSIFLGRQGRGYIVGLPLEESDRLLDLLWSHMTKPEFVWQHSWKVGDVVLWDNRCTVHMRENFDPSARRRLHRTTVSGEIPR